MAEFLLDLPFVDEINMDAFDDIQLRHGDEPVMPYLEVLIQPTNTYRFRYETERAHGCIGGRLHKSFPKVRLCNYFGESAIIRCMLYCHNIDKPHPYLLYKKTNRKIVYHEPYSIKWERNEKLNDYTISFEKMIIICVDKKNMLNKLKEKLLILKNGEFERLNNNKNTTVDEKAENEALEILSKCDLNKICLKFQAFDNKLRPICEAIYSDVIYNSKSTKTNELKIARISQLTSSSLGCEEIFLFVEKVDKKDIKIRFFELNLIDKIVWENYGIFKETDVHHQFGIVCKTPPYRDTNIITEVKVYIELFRPSDGARSEAHTFFYVPSNKMASFGWHQYYLHNKEKSNEDVDELFELYSNLESDDCCSSKNSKGFNRLY